MNRKPRVLLVGRRFWPHGSIDSAAHLIQLADGLHRHNVHVEVLTARFANSWPKSISFREIAVHRPAVAPRSEWSINRYVRSLTTWICEHGQSFDVLLTVSAREEALAVVDAARSLNCHSMVRVAGMGTESDLAWWTTSRSARRCASFVQSASGVIVSGAEQQRQLVSQGLTASRIHRIDLGFDGSNARSSSDQSAARRVLAATNRDLHAPVDEQVALCVTPLMRGGVEVLVDSVRHLVARYPNLHVWFIGDGEHRESIFHQLRGDGVRASIAMPGSFGDLQDVFAAADLFVQTDDHGLEHFLPTAVSAELPVVVPDTPYTREILRYSDDPGDDDWVHWFNHAVPKSFRTAIRSVLDDFSDSQQKSKSLRRQLVRRRSQASVIEDYVHTIQELRRQRISPDTFGAVS